MPIEVIKKRKFNGKVFHKRRLDLGLSLKEVAKKTKRSSGAVSFWETEKCNPNPKSAFLLAKALGVKVEDLFYAD